MNVIAYKGIVYKENLARLAQIDNKLKTCCRKRGDTVSGIVAGFFRISRAPMKVVCENIK